MLRQSLLFFLFLHLMCSGVQAAPLKGGVQHEDEGSRPLSSGLLMDDPEEAFSLPAGVKFEENVPPVGPELRLHKLFSSVQMPAEDGEDTWYRIPGWRAGSFHREKQIDHTRSGDQISTSRADHVYGMQMDKNGEIWHHMSWPRVTKVSSDDQIQYKIINRYTPVTVNPNEFCVRISSTNVFVDEKTGKIIRTAKQEEIDRYIPIADGLARGYCLIQGYSQHGRPNTLLQKCTVEEERTQPFAVVNKFRGKDLQQSFFNYLKSHDLADLIPSGPDISASE